MPSYKTKNTCSSKIKFDLEGNRVHNIKFYDGCSANLSVIAKLVEGMTVEELEERCKGVECGRRNTSCADQLAHAVRVEYEKNKQERIG